MPTRIGILIVTLLALTVSGVAAEKRETVAWVVQCSGDWEDQSEPARRIACATPRNQLWFPLEREAKLVRTGKKTKESITIRIARTGAVHSFKCDVPGSCEPPPAISELAPRTEASGMLEAFLTGPSQAYTQIRLMLSRSNNTAGTPVTVSHAVLTQGVPATLGDLIRPTTPAGEYLLELCPFNAETGCPTAHKPVKVKWDPRAPAPWPEPPLPGLFEVVLSEVNNGISMRTNDRGLVLVTTSANGKSAREQVKAGEALFLRDWKDAAEGKLMFQALLVYLASQAGK